MRAAGRGARPPVAPPKPYLGVAFRSCGPNGRGVRSANRPIGAMRAVSAAAVAAALLTLATLACAGSSVASVATPRWLAAERVAERADGGRTPDVAVSADGDSTVVYGGATGIEAVFRPAGGQGGAWARLAPCGSSPQVALDASGRALAVWLGNCEGRPTLEASVRAAGLNARWEEPVVLSTPGKIAQSPQLSMNPRGDAVVSWEEWDDWGRQFVVVQASFRSGDTGEWKPAVQLSSTGAVAWQLTNAINAAGDAAVAYTRSDPSGHVAWSAFRPRAGSWQAAEQLSQTGSNGWYPAIALDGHGNAIAVWLEDEKSVSSFRSRESGAWEPATSFPGTAAETALAVDPEDNALAVWPGVNGVLTSSRAAGPDGRWTDSLPVSQNAAGIAAVDVAFDVAGDALVFWASYPSPAASGSINISRRPAGMALWEQPVTLEVTRGAMGSSQYGVDARGNAVAVWEEEVWPAAVLAAVFDAAAPALRGLSVPSKGKVRRPVAVSVSFHDVSRVELCWRFGDGGSATGSRARHAYSRPGSYRVRVTATDAAGHTATVSKRIRITR